MIGYCKNVNAQTVQQILRYIWDENTPGRIPQPMFIMGNDGSGKTTLLRNLVSDLGGMDQSYRIQIFDGKQFFCSRDIIRAIEGEGCDENLISNNSNSGSRRIVIIDDLDFFFRRSSFDDQFILRNYIYRESSPLLIATLSGVSDALADYRAPFFEGVRILYIPPFDPQSVLTGFPADKTKRISDLMEYLPTVIGSLKIASGIVLLSDDSKDDLRELIGRFALFYRIKFKDMPVYTQKVLYALSRCASPMTLSELRESTGLSSGILSTYLRQLVVSGEIRKTEPGKRGTPYEICDRLFSVWLSGEYSFADNHIH